MFLLRTRLLKTNSLSVNLKTLSSFGVYWWWKLSILYYVVKKCKKGWTCKSILILTKFFVSKLFFNPELDKSLHEINWTIKQSIYSYVGMRLLLNLPVRGQWTKTNASTPRLLVNKGRKRHFVQKNNRWNEKDEKKNPKGKYEKKKKIVKIKS